MTRLTTSGIIARILDITNDLTTIHPMPSTPETEPSLSLAQCVTFACLLEASAPKPGNVHRGADFEDLTYFDFVASAAVIGPCFSLADQNDSVGTIVSRSVEATRMMVGTNTNLGTLLLLAPLALVPREEPLSTGIHAVLDRLDAEDARLVYQAIRLAHPGGMGQVEQDDLAETPPESLVDAMQKAAERDLVARQYTNGFQEVLSVVVADLQAGLARGDRLSDTIVWAHVRLMSQFPDSLIRRKCGEDVALQSAAKAAAVIGAGAFGERGPGERGPGDPDYRTHLADLDFWLRCDSNRRNPGTTADLIAAGLFVCLRDGVIRPPFSMFGER